MFVETTEFVEAWQAAETLQAVVARFAEVGLTTRRATEKAAKLRKRGLELKKFPRGRGPGNQPAKSTPGPSLAKTHENEATDWMAPEWVADCARGLMGEIDLDPASSSVANQLIGAETIYTEADGGLVQDWATDTGYPSRVFIKPPGRQVLEFWDKLCVEWDANRVLSAFWVGFNVDHLRWLLTRPKHPLQFYVCIPKMRIKFISTQYKPGDKNRPSCANYLVWLPDEDCNENWARFCEVMGKHGRCIRGDAGHYAGESHTKHPNTGIAPRNRLSKRVRSSNGTGSGAGA